MEHIERIYSLERWRDGNGKPGAAAMIGDHEKRISKNESKIDEHERRLNSNDIYTATEPDRLKTAVNSAMKEHSKTAAARIKAYAPILIALIYAAVDLIKTAIGG